MFATYVEIFLVYKELLQISDSTMINLTHRKLGKEYDQETDKDKQRTEKPVINS